MLWLLLACSGGAGGPGGADLECEPVYQTVDTETPGDTPSGFQYCAAADDGSGRFDRITAEACTEGGFCSDDAECGDGQACICGAGVAYGDDGWRSLTALSQCVASFCSSPDDCDGRACSLTFDACGGAQALACHTADDTCDTDADCGDTGFCFYTGAKWTCEAKSTCE